MASDRYSRLIAWLKVLLPLMALALLSTLFLLSRTVDPETQIPFADKEIQDRLRDQQVTGPFFTGSTTDGDEISFSAEKLTTPQGQTGANEAQVVRVELATRNGATVTLDADRASIDIAADQANLIGGVKIVTSTGYRLTSDLLSSSMSALNLISPGPVQGAGPGGTLNAGSMQLVPAKDGSGAQLIFKDQVKMVYDPEGLEE